MQACHNSTQVWCKHRTVIMMRLLTNFRKTESKCRAGHAERTRPARLRVDHQRRSSSVKGHGLQIDLRECLYQQNDHQHAEKQPAGGLTYCPTSHLSRR